MPNEDNRILKNNPGEKSMKVLFIIYADLECLLKKMHSCQNYPKKSYTEKMYAYTLWLFIVSMFIWCNKT